MKPLAVKLQASRAAPTFAGPSSCPMRHMQARQCCLGISCARGESLQYFQSTTNALVGCSTRSRLAGGTKPEAASWYPGHKDFQNDELLYTSQIAKLPNAPSKGCRSLASRPRRTFVAAQPCKNNSHVWINDGSARDEATAGRPQFASVTEAQLKVSLRALHSCRATKRT